MNKGFLGLKHHQYSHWMTHNDKQDTFHFLARKTSLTYVLLLFKRMKEQFYLRKDMITKKLYYTYNSS